MLLEDDIRLIAGLHGWKFALKPLHRESQLLQAYIYAYSYGRWRKHCLGFFQELQRMTYDQVADLVHSYAKSPKEST